jgi:hypothetical protein
LEKAAPAHAIAITPGRTEIESEHGQEPLDKLARVLFAAVLPVVVSSDEAKGPGRKSILGKEYIVSMGGGHWKLKITEKLCHVQIPGADQALNRSTRSWLPKAPSEL